MPCEADPNRHRFNSPGWECSGKNLVTVARALDMPIVAPIELLPEVFAEADSAWNTEPYTGGDHYHWARTGTPATGKLPGSPLGEVPGTNRPRANP